MKPLRIPNSFALSAVSWDIFGTLTFRKEVSEKVAIGRCQDWLELLRQKFYLPESDYYWFLRVERGERGGRVHLHVLLKVPSRFFGYFILRKGRISVAHKLWGHGLTSFRRIYSELDFATTYLMKASNMADAYELEKTNRADGIASNAVLKRARLQQSGGRATCEHAMT